MHRALLGMGLGLLGGCMQLQALRHPLPAIPDPPSAAWVGEQLPEFRRLAGRYPTEHNLQALRRLELYAAYYQDQDARAARIARALSLAWINHGRGGAALRQPAYVHSLGADYNRETHNGAALAPQAGLRDGPPAAVSAGVGRGRGYSLYEMSRWSRYCDQGRGMDEPDWQFVSGEGAPDHLPTYLRPRCAPPSHDYAAYLSAWQGFCAGRTRDARARAIVGASVRPQSLGGCAALNLR